MSSYLQSSADAPRRTNRWLLVLGGCFLVVLLLLGVDRGAAWLVGQQQARQLATDFSMSEPPRVTFEGFPFLNQLAASHFSRVLIDADEMSVDAGEQQFVLRDAHLELTDVRGISQPVAGELHGTGVLDWQSLGSLVGSPITFAGSDANGDGRIEVTYTVPVFGAQLTANVTGTPVLDPQAQTLDLSNPTIDVAGYELPAQVAEQLIGQFAGNIALDLPLGLRVDTVQATPHGMAVTISGTDVDFSGPP